MEEVLINSYCSRAYIDVSSVDEYSIKLEKLGGIVVMQKTPVPWYGIFCSMS